MTVQRPTIQLADRLVGEGQPVYIIAEAGVNHNGSLKMALQLVDMAAASGADAVKFQKRNVDRILTRAGLEMAYENPNSFGKTYGEHKRALELSEADYRELLSCANELDVDFTASGWDEESVDFLDELGVAFFKMASADLTNLPLLEHTAKKGRPLILSTGMADLGMVKRAYSAVRKYTPLVAVLQCTSTYPVRFEEINLKVLETFRQTFPEAVIGYSGHELGIAVSEAAVVLGARIVERHFTLDRTMKGGDHAASLEPCGLQKLIRDVRHIEAAIGNGKKRMQESEGPYFEKLAKSVVTAVPIAKGAIITLAMLTTKGPGTGISPARMDEVIGKPAKVDLRADVVIKEAEIEWEDH